jgi:hypothetical protein
LEILEREILVKNLAAGNPVSAAGLLKASYHEPSAGNPVGDNTYGRTHAADSQQCRLYFKVPFPLSKIDKKPDNAQDMREGKNGDGRVSRDGFAGEEEDQAFIGKICNHVEPEPCPSVLTNRGPGVRAEDALFGEARVKVQNHIKDKDGADEIFNNQRVRAGLEFES